MWYRLPVQSGSRKPDNRVVPAGEILVGILEIAAFMRLNHRTVTGLIRSGGLPVTRCGLGKVSTKGAIIRWLERRAENGSNG